MAGILAIALWLARSGSYAASPTYDEPVHLAASYVASHEGDYRVNPEHPPAWKWLVGSTMARGDLPVNLTSPLYRRVEATPRAEWQWAATVTGGRGRTVDLDGMVANARAVTMAWGALLLILTGVTGWMTAGVRGAIVGVAAMAMLAADPAFLAHSALVTNDVPFATCTLVFVLALAWVAKRATPWNVAILGAAGAAAMLVKFAAVALLPMAAVVLAVRALSAGEWGKIRSRRAKLTAAAAALAGSLVVAYLGVWEGYGFRYAAAKPGIDAPLALRAEYEEIAAARGGNAGAAAKIMLWAGEKHLVPEALCAGMLTQWRIAQKSRAFVLGENREPVPWYALVLAWGLKTPMGIVVCVGTGLGMLAWSAKGRVHGQDARATGVGLARTLGLCAGVFLLMAILSGRGRGVRYLLPLLPMLYLLAWLGLARIRGGWIVGLACLALAGAEVAAARGRYISFFNFASRTLGQPYELLGDSNLDWGQGLKELAGWRAANPQAKVVYIAYFGTVNPSRYVDDFLPALPGYFLEPDSARRPDTKGAYLAISATLLQGTYLPDDLRDLYAPYRKQQPLARLAGGSILVFEVK